MNTTRPAYLLAALLGMLSPVSALADTANTPPMAPATLNIDPSAPPAPPADVAPVTIASAPVAPAELKLVLAMDRILPGTTEDKVKRLLADETRAVVNLYLAGQIRQWYFRQDRPGAVFLLEVTDLDQARSLLGGLPLSKAGLVDYDLVPVGPYIPLARLLQTAPAPASAQPAKNPRKR